jgi:hypothetical protein
MPEDFAAALAWGVGAIALFSFLAVAAWTTARQKEREAFYKSEAIKKLAEMQGATPEPVLQVLREAVATWKHAPSAALMGPAQAKAYYKAETLKKIAEMPGSGAEAILTVMREEERVSRRRVRDGLRLAGFITCAVGIGLAVFLRVIVPEMPVYLSGFIPLLVGIALLAYAYTQAPNDGPVS